MKLDKYLNEDDTHLSWNELSTKTKYYIKQLESEFKGVNRLSEILDNIIENAYTDGHIKGFKSYKIPSIEKVKRDIKDLSPKLKKDTEQTLDFIDDIDRSNKQYPLSSQCDDIIYRTFEEAYDMGHNDCLDNIKKHFPVR